MLVYFMTFFLLFIGGVLMIIILLQRGRGGGLAGAFGGLGGQSAFGTKAGDVFTKITVVLATIWVVLAGTTGLVMRSEAEGRFKGGKEVAPENPEAGSADAEKTKSDTSDPTKNEAGDQKEEEDDQSKQGQSSGESNSGNDSDGK